MSSLRKSQIIDHDLCQYINLLWTDENVLIGSVISSHCTSAPTVLSEQLNWHNFFTNMLISVHCEKKIQGLVASLLQTTKTGRLCHS
jgi:hypothetical protein